MTSNDTCESLVVKNYVSKSYKGLKDLYYKINKVTQKAR